MTNMRPLMIDHLVKAAIAEAIAFARQHPASVEDLEKYGLDYDGERNNITLEESEEVNKVEKNRGGVKIPFGYLAIISFEQQPEAGLCKHLSVSVDTPGRVPSIPALKMIAAEFGIFEDNTIGMWTEEFEPGHHAINLVAKEATQ